MIVLRADAELKNTFEKLIQTMKVPVEWNGLFVVIDNYMILQGEVRSLFFHFDTRKAATNILDIPVKEEDIKEAAGNNRVRNVINLILYAFGKWGAIQGLRVEKNYEQLNQLFGEVTKEFEVEAEYNYEHFRFYKEGIRITYEDVIQYALEWQETAPEETEEETPGLWHKLVWKKIQSSFPAIATTLAQRRKQRLGNNFYMVGYCCPKCGANLHMVVYPVGKEFRIETEEGTVLLARAFTCDACNSFYTPRPQKMLSEGDAYCMDFGDDRKAYEDYMELLGKHGRQTTNHNFNEFADRAKQAQTQRESAGQQDGGMGDVVDENLDADDWEERLIREISDCPDERLREIEEKLETGFYPESSVAYIEECIDREQSRRKARRADGRTQENDVGSVAKKYADGQTEERKSGAEHAQGAVGQTSRNIDLSDGESEQTSRGMGRSSGVNGQTGRTAEETGHTTEKVDNVAGWADRVSPEAQKAQERYEARLELLERLSPRQMGELKSQLEHENLIAPQLREEYLERVNGAIEREKAARLTKKVDSCKDSTYVMTKRVAEEVEREDLPRELRESLLEKLRGFMERQGEREVRQLMEKMPPHMDRARYRQFEQKIRSYEGVDTAPYEQKLRDSREEAERQEIANVVNRAKKSSRSDYASLAEKLRDGDFLPELVTPYLEKIEGTLHKMDEEALAEITGDTLHMTFDEAAEAYTRVRDGEFLPELKTNALEMLAKRLSKIKTDECELLVKRLQEDFAKAGVGDNPKHHFYPARRVLLKQAAPEETEVIDYALASYAAGRGMFEYPIFVADTSRNGSGKEGFLLTPEHFYYSTMMTSYGFAVSSIEKIKASTGLLNRGLYVYRRNGTKTKVPTAVDVKELPALAQALDGFVHYLQEKPQSRQITYLAKDKHERICCFRCGYVYQGTDTCPKCGFKNNE